MVVLTSVVEPTLGLAVPAVKRHFKTAETSGVGKVQPDVERQLRVGNEGLQGSGIDMEKQITLTHQELLLPHVVSGGVMATHKCFAIDGRSVPLLPSA
jgi:hypothetical protein